MALDKASIMGLMQAIHNSRLQAASSQQAAANPVAPQVPEKAVAPLPTPGTVTQGGTPGFDPTAGAVTVPPGGATPAPIPTAVTAENKGSPQMADLYQQYLRSKQPPPAAAMPQAPTGPLQQGDYQTWGAGAGPQQPQQDPNAWMYELSKS